MLLFSDNVHASDLINGEEATPVPMRIARHLRIIRTNGSFFYIFLCPTCQLLLVSQLHFALVLPEIMSKISGVKKSGKFAQFAD